MQLQPLANMQNDLLARFRFIVFFRKQSPDDPGFNCLNGAGPELWLISFLTGLHPDVPVIPLLE